MGESKTLLTFDIGGTTTRCGMYRDGELAQTGRVATPQTKTSEHDDAEPLLHVLKELTDEALGGSEIDGVAVAVTGMLRIVSAPGVVDYGPFKDRELVLSSPNIAGLKNVQLLQLLERVGWGVPIHVENDANAALRAAVDVPTALGVNMGTGIAAAVKVDNRIQHFDGYWSCQEIGHGCRWTFPEAPARRCACGLTGCLEAVVGSRSLAERYGVKPEDAPADVYGQMRSDLLRYAALAVLDTAKRFDQTRVLFSGQSILGFSADGLFMWELADAMRELDPWASQMVLDTVELPEITSMWGTVLAGIDHGVFV